MNNQGKLVQCFVNALGVNESKVTPSLKYQSITEWDSVSHMVLISEIEEAFEISLETDDVVDMSSFKKAMEIVSKYNISF
jgi:acyl carrier protein